MKAALESLSKIGAELYQAAQAAQAAGAAGAAEPAAAAAADGAGGEAQPKPTKKSEGKVVDADVEIVDDEKK